MKQHSITVGGGAMRAHRTGKPRLVENLKHQGHAGGVCYHITRQLVNGSQVAMNVHLTPWELFDRTAAAARLWHARAQLRFRIALAAQPLAWQHSITTTEKGNT